VTLSHHCHNNVTYPAILTKSKGQTDMDGATVSPINQRDPRCEAIELYGTTDLSVAEIASQTGVSKETVYRWLRKERIAFGRSASNETAGQASEHTRGFSDEINELRREVTTLIGQVRRLEGLVEALVGLKTQPV
jgi:transposase-like protein